MAVRLGKAQATAESALAEAARILAGSRLALLTGTGSDVAGARAALRLAERIGGAVDFRRDPALLALDALMAERGLIFTTPAEARARADSLLLIGPGVARSAMLAQVLKGTPLLAAPDGAERTTLWLCPGSAADTLPGFGIQDYGGDLSAIHGILALLNAAMRGHPAPGQGFGGLAPGIFEDIAGRLITARYGVVAFSPADLDALAMEALLSFVQALNQTTRAALLPVSSDAGTQTFAHVSGWLTGFPPRTGFMAGAPDYDPWRFDATRLIECGECDALLWLSSFEASAPPWRTKLPLIVICPPGAQFVRPPEVLIETAIPGNEADAEFWSEASQSLVAVKAAGPTGGLTAAAALTGILDRLETSSR
ncbi:MULTISPECIES: hypothetical protein [Rhodomicrobium]|uniref:hypothetical protein n=1 Tax=Rhodomicrobium TaxID=1068 RepID=UPI000B4BF37A|nr:MULTISPECIES: hypothetical protein [Rhodomicrobium]